MVNVNERSCRYIASVGPEPLAAGSGCGLHPVVFGTAAEHVDLSDFELEQWFARHRLEIINLASLDVVRSPLAHAIGPPANDNDG